MRKPTPDVAGLIAELRDWGNRSDEQDYLTATAAADALEAQAAQLEQAREIIDGYLQYSDGCDKGFHAEASANEAKAIAWLDEWMKAHPKPAKDG